jgi:hypothetical protein
MDTIYTGLSLVNIPFSLPSRKSASSSNSFGRQKAAVDNTSCGGASMLSVQKVVLFFPYSIWLRSEIKKNN